MEIAKLPMISLQRQALTNFASSVWVKANKQSLRSFLDKLKLSLSHAENYNFERYSLKYKSLNDQAIVDLKRLNIPPMTMMIMTDVGQEIIKWLKEIKDHVNDTTLEHQVSNLSWTVEGPLNRNKMARTLLENETDLDLSFSFNMACNYCLEDKIRELWPRIRELWPRITEERQLNYFDGEDMMEKYWLHKLDGHLPNIPYDGVDLELNLTSFIETRCFLRVVCSRCFSIETVKFVFNSLSDEKKIEALNNFNSSSRYRYIRCDEAIFAYMLSHFNVMEMRDLISRYDIKTLMSNFKYFAWPNTKLLKALDHYIGKMKGTKNTNGSDLLKLADGSLGYFRRYNQKISFRYYWSRFSKNGLNKAIKGSLSSLKWSPLLPGVFLQLFRNEDDVSIKMVIDSIGVKGYPKDICHRCDAIFRLGNYDLNLMKYYLARTVHTKSLAKELVMRSDFYDFEFSIPLKDIVAETLIEVFPHWNLYPFD